MKKKVTVLLADGSRFEGYRFGADGDAVGEGVFHAGVIGYLETLTDPNNHGQVVVETFPMIGNYGVASVDVEGKKPAVAAYIVREFCDKPSNFRMDTTLDAYMKENGVIGVYGVDTRAITAILRDKGTMNIQIADIPDAKAMEGYKVQGGVEKASCKEVQAFGEGVSIAVLDCGCGSLAAESLAALGVKASLYPYNTNAEELLKHEGIVISDGPGNPKDYEEIIEQVKACFGKKPMLGIGLGHNLVALAAGGETYALHHGHRSGNQPVRDMKTGKVLITTQNHGYAVSEDSLKAMNAEILYTNINDGTIEGLVFPGKKCKTLQFRPEGCSRPNQTRDLYMNFIAETEEK